MQLLFLDFMFGFGCIFTLITIELFIWLPLFKLHACWPHPTHSSLRKESPAELMLLTFEWDTTASGTVRRKTENRHTIPSPMLLLAVPEAVSSDTKMRSISAVQSIFCVAPCCPRGSLVPYKSEENQFHPVLALLLMGAPMAGCATSAKVFLEASPS